MKALHWWRNTTLFLALAFLLGMPSLGEEEVSADNSDEWPTTGFEDSDGEEWTTHEEELAFIEEVSEQSERLTYSEVGESVEGRPLHLVQVGYPEPPSDESIADGRNILIVGAQHGNEPAGREMALKFMRDLAFTDDSDLVDQLSEATVMFIPTANPDAVVTTVAGGNQRINAQGKDINRDALSLITPESQVLAEVMNQYNPDMIVDAHERFSEASDVSIGRTANLNMDDEVRDLNMELAEDYVFPDVEDAGFTVEWYPIGHGFPTNLRTRSSLSHKAGILIETTRAGDPVVRVQAQMQTVESVLRFYRERLDDVVTVITEAPDRTAAIGADQSEPFYLSGVVGDLPPESDVLDPPPCGYLLNTSQAEDVEQQIELFNIETEVVSEDGVFVTMAQPMMTLVPYLLDERFPGNNVVDGLALYDCTDPGSVNPPEPPESQQYETDFSEEVVGEPPAEWSTLWRESGWTVLDNPSRLEHYVTIGGGRRAMTWDAIDKVRGDVEVSGLVRARAEGALFQLHLHASDDGSERSYYLDLNTSDNVRINRNLNGRFRVLETAEVPFTAEEHIWYHAVLQREDDTLKGKVWPYGEDEPDEWQVTVDDPFIDFGKPGVGLVGTGKINEWAFFGVGTAGESAPRAPENLPDVDKTMLQREMNRINDENLNEEDYSEVSWQELQDALINAEDVLDNPDATQPEVDGSLDALVDAYEGLQTASAQYETDFSEEEVGAAPGNWTTLWRDSGWTVLDNPSRLEHYVTEGGGRRVLTWDAVDEVRGDVEVSGLVRARAEGALFQLHLHGSGEAGSDTSYYLDLNANSNSVRINRNLNGGFQVLQTAEAPFTAEEHTWYHAILQREDDTLKGKVWPYGEDEPDEWQVSVDDPNIDIGKPGVGLVGPGKINEWAFFGVGTGGDTAPRAPEGLIVPSADEIKYFVERFDDEGALSNEESVRHLQTHLTAISHYEDQEDADKVTQHMGGFKVLLEHQRDNDLITEDAFDVLNTHADKLIEAWQ